MISHAIQFMKKTGFFQRDNHIWLFYDQYKYLDNSNI